MDTPKVPPIVVSPNLQKTVTRLDKNGNFITDHKTKQIITPKEEEPIAPQEPQAQPQELSIKQLTALIEQKEDEISELKVKRREKIKDLRAQLEEIEELE